MSDSPQLTPPPERAARNAANYSITAWVAIIIALISTAITTFVWFQADSALNIAHQANHTASQVDTQNSALGARVDTLSGYQQRHANDLKVIQTRINQLKSQPATGTTNQAAAQPNPAAPAAQQNPATPPASEHQQALHSLSDQQGQLQQNMTSTMKNLNAMGQQIKHQNTVLQQQSDTIAKQQHQLNQQSVKQQQQQLSLSDARLHIRELLRGGSSSNRQWIIGEAEYLTRLAQLQLSINHDPAAALRLLKSADQDLASLNDDRLQPARLSLNRDIQKLQAITPVDIGGIIKRLNTISAKVADMPIEPRTQFTPAPEATTSPDKNTNQKNSNQGSTASTAPVTGYEAAIAGLKKLVIIKKLTAAPEMASSMDEINYAKEHIRLKISQAEWAVLHKNQEVYQQNISLAQTLLGKLPASDNQKPIISRIINQLQQLKKEPIFAKTPDLHDSIATIRSMLVSHQTETDNTLSTPASTTGNQPATPAIGNQPPTTSSQPPVIQKSPPSAATPPTSTPTKPQPTTNHATPSQQTTTGQPVTPKQSTQPSPNLKDNTSENNTHQFFTHILHQDSEDAIV